MAKLTTTTKKMSNCHSLLSAALNWNSISGIACAAHNSLHQPQQIPASYLYTKVLWGQSSCCKRRMLKNHLFSIPSPSLELFSIQSKGESKTTKQKKIMFLFSIFKYISGSRKASHRCEIVSPVSLAGSACSWTALASRSIYRSKRYWLNDKGIHKRKPLKRNNC